MLVGGRRSVCRSSSDQRFKKIRLFSLAQRGAGRCFTPLSQTFDSMRYQRLCVALDPTVRRSKAEVLHQYSTSFALESPCDCIKLHKSSIVDINRGASLAVDTSSVGETRPATQPPCVTHVTLWARDLSVRSITAGLAKELEGQTPPTSWPAQTLSYFACLRHA